MNKVTVVQFLYYQWVKLNNWKLIAVGTNINSDDLRCLMILELDNFELEKSK